MALKVKLNKAEIATISNVIAATTSGIIHDHIKLAGSEAGVVTYAAEFTRERDYKEITKIKAPATEAGKKVFVEE